MSTRPIWLRPGNGGGRIDTRNCCDGKCTHGERCPALLEQQEPEPKDDHDYRPGLYLAAVTALVGWVGFIALVRWLAQ